MEPVPVIPLEYQQSGGSLPTGLRRLKRGVLLIAISLLLSGLTIAFELLIVLQGVFGWNTWRAVRMMGRVDELPLVLGGWFVLGVHSHGTRGFTAARLIIAAVLTASFLAFTQQYLAFTVGTPLSWSVRPRYLWFASEVGETIAGLLVLGHALRVLIGGGLVQRGAFLLVSTGLVAVCWFLIVCESALYRFGLVSRFAGNMRVAGFGVSPSSLYHIQLAMGGIDALACLLTAVAFFLTLRELRRRYRTK